MPLSLTVKTLDSRNHVFDGIDESLSVRAFKDHIAETVGVATERQRLIYCGRVLQDEKKLKEYNIVDGKVLHLVQRPPNSSNAGGSDPLASSEARARGSSATRVTRGHIHVHHERPGGGIIPQISGSIPSMGMRLNVAREMLRRSTAVISRLENPSRNGSSATTSTTTTQTSTSTSSSTTTSTTTTFSSQSEASATEGNASATSSAGAVNFGIDTGSMPAPVAEAIQSAVNQAVQVMSEEAVNMDSNQSLSMSIQIDGEVVSADPASAPEPVNDRSNVTAASRDQDGQPGRQQPSYQRQGHQPRHPTPAELAEVMEMYSQTETRLAPFRERMMQNLRADATFSNEAERVEAQQIFTSVTEVMHFLSHAQHALSDAIINHANPPPREVRARQQVVAMGPFGFAAGHGAVPRRTTNVRPTTRPAGTQESTRRSSSSDRSRPVSQPEAAVSGTTASSTSSDSNANSSSDSMDTTEETTITAEVEVNVEPIVVRVDVDQQIQNGSGPAAGGASIAPNPQTLQQLIQSALGGAMGGHVHIEGIPAGPPPAPSGGGEAPRTTSSSSSASPTVTVSGPQGPQTTNSASSQARGTSGTQPTTSTRTRSTAHVHYALPPGNVGHAFQMPGASMFPGLQAHQFDPLLPCNSHHVAIRGAMNRRMRHSAGAQADQRQRSSSVPPRNVRVISGVRPPPSMAQQSSTVPPQGQQAHSFSAQSSPARSASRVNVGPQAFVWDNVLGNGSFGQIGVVPVVIESVANRAAPPNGNAGVGGIEPGLANLLGALQTNSPEDAGMLNVIQGVLSHLTGALAPGGGSGGGGGQQQNEATVSSFLENLPDYSYTEGESLVTDLLMCLARRMTFRDLINIVLGSPSSLDNMQEPLREFMRRRVLIPPNDDERHDIDSAVLLLVDSSFDQLEEVASIASVRSDIDFAETLHSFLANNLTTIAEIILTAPSTSEFGTRFRQGGQQLLSRLMRLCQRCFVDGNASVERVAQNRLEAISGDVGPNVREWTVSATMGHLRNYIASANQSNVNTAEAAEDVEQYVVLRGPDSEARKQARGRRLQQQREQQQMHEDEDFATPRSSPEHMDTSATERNDEEGISARPEPVGTTTAAAEVSSTAESASGIIAPPPLPQTLMFPTELLARSDMGPDMAVGSQGWHRELPAEWVPIVARDIQRQRQQGSHEPPQSPFSDAYLSTQAAKRRKIARDNKPEGPVERVVMETLEEAINASGVQPLNSTEEVSRETSKLAAVQKAARKETQSSVGRRLKKDPDFDPQKFPNSSNFTKQS